MKRAGARHLDDIGAPLALGSMQLNVGAAPAHPLPRRERQVLHLAHADIAVDRNVLRFHEKVVGRLRTIELAEARALETRRLMPMDLTGDFVHGALLNAA